MIKFIFYYHRPSLYLFCFMILSLWLAFPFLSDLLFTTTSASLGSFISFRCSWLCGVLAFSILDIFSKTIHEILNFFNFHTGCSPYYSLCLQSLWHWSLFSIDKTSHFLCVYSTKNTCFFLLGVFVSLIAHFYSLCI